jgi:transcriptional regulator with XRE-family HTH domain
MEIHEQEARRLVELLGRIVKLSGRSQRSIEAEVGLGSSVLGKILNGIIAPKLAQVLMICDALGLPPGEFFQMAYPTQGIRSQLAQEVLAAEGISVDGRVPDDLDDRVRESFGRLLDELRGKL